MGQRMEVWQILFIGGIILVPSFLVGGILLTEKLAFDNDVQMVIDHRVEELAERLSKASPDDRLLQNYGLVSGIFGPPNALSVAAEKCDEQIVLLFFTIASDRMTNEYVADAHEFFEVQLASQRCPSVGALFRKERAMRRQR